MQTVVVCSNKGGVGKTTLALGLASLMSKHSRTCLIETDLVGAGLGITPPLLFREKRADFHEYLLPMGDRPRQAADLLSEVSLEGSDFEVITAWIGSSGQIGKEETDPKHGALALVQNCAPWIEQKLAELLDELAGAGVKNVVLDTHPGIVHVTQVVVNVAARRKGKVVFVASEDSPASLAGLISDMSYYFSAVEQLPARSVVAIQKAQGKWPKIKRPEDLVPLVAECTGWPRSVIRVPLKHVRAVATIRYQDGLAHGYGEACMNRDFFVNMGVHTLASVLHIPESSK